MEKWTKITVFLCWKSYRGRKRTRVGVLDQDEVVAFTRQAIKGLLQDEVLQTSQVHISGSCGVRSRLVLSES